MQPYPSVPKAALWMAGWLSLMIVIAVAGREATHELAVFQIMELRSLIGLVMLYPLIRAAGGFGAMKTTRLWHHAARNTVHYAAQFGWFVALTLIPLAQVVALEFTMPIWTACLAVGFLGERMNVWKALAIVLGLIGVGLIVRPAAAGLSAGQAIALAAAVGFAVSVTLTKSLTRTDSAVAIIFWMLVFQSLIGAVPALATWRWPSATSWGWVLVIAFCGTFSHYCMARAMRHAEATTVVPMDFLRVPLMALAGWLVYAERIDLFTVIARTVTAGGGGYGTQRVERAIALGCAAEHAERLIYTQGHAGPETATPIGVTCRLCQRTECTARSAPPIGRQILPDDIRRTTAPFGFSDA